MNRRVLFLPSALLAAVAVAACSGSPATLAPGSTPGAATATAVAPVTPGVTLAPGATFALPQGTPVADLSLIARFPQKIGDSVCENSAFTLASQIALVPSLGQTYAPLVQLMGVGAESISFGDGSCDIVVNENSYSPSWDGIAVHGADANRLLQSYPQLAQIFGNGAPTMGSASVGGRNVTTATDPNGSLRYLWVSGDAVISYNSEDDPAVDNAVVAAFPN